MNHWQLVIQDIWSVARYAMPLLLVVCGWKLCKSDDANNVDKTGNWVFASICLTVATWLCMAGDL